MSVVELDASLADEAARLDPAQLRSLDPVHMASALRLGPALGSMVSYDERILDAAKRHGVAVAHPGWPPTERSPSSQGPADRSVRWRGGRARRSRPSTPVVKALSSTA